MSTERRMSGYCEVQVDHDACGKPAKGRMKNGNLACGMHLCAEKKRDERREAENTRREDSERALAVALNGVVQLAKYGIKATVYYRTGIGGGVGRYTGEVVIDPAEVLEILSNESRCHKPAELHDG